MTGPGWPSVPALFTAASRRPKRATVWSTSAAHLVVVAHVGAHEFGFGAERAQFVGERLAGVVAAAGDDEAGAVAAKASAVARPMPVRAPVIENDGLGHFKLLMGMYLRYGGEAGCG